MIWNSKKTVRFGKAAPAPFPGFELIDEDMAMQSMDRILPAARSETDHDPSKSLGWTVFPSNVERRAFMCKFVTGCTATRILTSR